MTTPTTPQPVAIGPGRARQGQIYRAGAFGRAPRVPADFAELERRAATAMSPRAWAYVAGGAGQGDTMRANRTAFDRWQVVPRMLAGHTSRDLGVTVLGRRLPAPLLLAPIGAAELVCAGSDLMVGRAAAQAGVPYVISNQGCSPMEQIGEAMGEAPRWFQLYWSTDEALVDSLLGRAERSGAEAVVVTLDTTMLGWRPQDLNLGSLPFSQGIGIAQYTSDPRFRQVVAERVAASAGGGEGGGGEGGDGGDAGGDPKVTLGALRTLLSVSRRHPGRLRDNLRSAQPRAAVETFLDIYSNPGLAWDQLATVLRRTTLPVLVKGIQHPDDARRALDLGFAGIVVSNHGGRQVDGAVGSLEMLPSIRAAVGPQALVVFDSGIRSGADVVKALALGADVVMVGRPYIYGLALDGSDGVRAVIANLVAELDLTMGLAGVRALEDLTPDLLRPTPR